MRGWPLRQFANAILDGGGRFPLPLRAQDVEQAVEEKALQTRHGVQSSLLGSSPEMAQISRHRGDIGRLNVFIHRVTPSDFLGEGRLALASWSRLGGMLPPGEGYQGSVAVRRTRQPCCCQLSFNCPDGLLSSRV